MQKQTKNISLLFMLVAFVHTGPIFESIDKSRNVVRCDRNDKCISNDCHHTNALQDPMPDSCEERKEWVKELSKVLKRQWVTFDTPQINYTVLTDQYQLLLLAWVSSTVSQICMRPVWSRWCCWAEPAEEPEEMLPQRWWWNQTGALHRGVMRIRAVQADHWATFTELDMNKFIHKWS